MYKIVCSKCFESLNTQILPSNWVKVSMPFWLQKNVFC